MHLIFLNQYYPPDAAPTGVMLEGLVEALLKDGLEVTVLCASGGYAQGVKLKSEKEELESKIHSSKANLSALRIVRIGATRFGRGSFVGKLMDYASYYLGVTWHLLFRGDRPDRIVALTTPPFLSVIARMASKVRGADHGHWVMDLYPDVMVAHGMLRENGVRHRILAGVARWGFGGGRCAAVLTLGPDMAARTALLMGERKDHIGWVPLWGESERGAGVTPASSFPSGEEKNQSEVARQDAPSSVSSGTLQPPEDASASPDRSAASAALRVKRGWRDDELIVMYSGNMGLGHRFGELLAAARALADEPVKFVFFGDGKRREELRAYVHAHPECRIELHDYAPSGELSAHLMSADVQVASLDPAWTGTMVPSKLQGVFNVGKPLIFIGSGQSSIGNWVMESGGGWVVGPHDVAGLLDVLKQAGDPAQRHAKGLAARNYALAHFNKELNAARIARLFARHGVKESQAGDSSPR